MMNEIYKRPILKTVIFQITFPNLFFMESKIPDIQLELINEYPESSLIINQPVVFANLNQNNKEKEEQPMTQKIWQFKSSNGYTLNISSNSLSLTSDVHKTYNNPEGGVIFRDVIDQCLNVFGKHIRLPLVNRIGLRYIDEYQLEDRTTINYEEAFNTALSITKFPIDFVQELNVRVVKKVDDCYLIYQEIFNFNNSRNITLDFDGFKTSIKFDNCLNVTDTLHELISNEFMNTVKQPIIDYMRGISHEK